MSDNNLKNHTEHSHQHSLQDEILAKIHEGKVQMKPRWQFILRGSLMAVGLVLAALALLFTGSFIIFLLQQNGTWFVPAFGGPGIKELFLALPLVFIAVALIFLVLLQLLVHRYSFSYAQPVLYSVVAIGLFVTIGSFLVARVHMHEVLLKQANQQGLPIAGQLYKQFANQKEDRVVTGIIVQQFENGFYIKDRQDRQITVIVTPNTQFPTGRDIDRGDVVIVLGQRQGLNMLAEGIRTIEGREGDFEDVDLPPAMQMQ